MGYIHTQFWSDLLSWAQLSARSECFFKRITKVGLKRIVALIFLTLCTEKTEMNLHSASYIYTDIKIHISVWAAWRCAPSRTVKQLWQRGGYVICSRMLLNSILLSFSAIFPGKLGAFTLRKSRGLYLLWLAQKLVGLGFKFGFFLPC